MKIVIQCAAGKQSYAGHFETQDNRPVQFVAHPEMAPSCGGVVYKHPDDRAYSGLSYRKELVEYNRRPESNPLGLLPAWRLYRNPVYAKLFCKLGAGNLFILSAGWGLIAADFLTPDYDITFSKGRKVDPYKRRSHRDYYEDCSMLPADCDGPIIFLGGQDYLPLFCHLTKGTAAERIIFYNSKDEPKAFGCTLRRFETTTKTNWHYECARDLMHGNIAV